MVGLVFQIFKSSRIIFCLFQYSDIITINSNSSNSAILDETNIALPEDVSSLYAQVSGYQQASKLVYQQNVNCSSVGLPSGCKFYPTGKGSYIGYYYPQDPSTQYLYESYPGIISPLEGVTNEHFIVWMRAEGD